MISYSCSQEQFLKDVESHKMIVLKDDGINRHIRFKRPDSGAFWFDLITWPGALCIEGDMGTYVFRRLEDMFQFFRTDAKYAKEDELGINPGYWGEKLQAIATHGKYKEFSFDLVSKAVKTHFDSWVESENPTEKTKTKLWEAIEEYILSSENCEPHEIMEEIQNFDWNGFRFTDFWETRTEDFTFHYIWCCYAIAWGIKQYDRK